MLQSTTPALRSRRHLAGRHLAALTLLALMGAMPAVADWLVTPGGERIETRGAWTVAQKRVFFTDAGGKPTSLRAEAVDLAASEAATARAKEPAAEVQASQITLYATSWCGYCRKTRVLLKELDAPYVEKDIEKSAEARKEHQAKGKGYGGVPLLDIGGTVVLGYQPEEIRRQVEALKSLGAGAQGAGER